MRELTWGRISSSSSDNLVHALKNVRATWTARHSFLPLVGIGSASERSHGLISTRIGGPVRQLPSGCRFQESCLDIAAQRPPASVHSGGAACVSARPPSLASLALRQSTRR
jgi:hypothetical protein